MNKRVAEGVIIVLLVVALDLVSQKYSLFYIFWWYDWMLHLFGGISIGLIAGSLFPGRTWRVLGITLGIAILWEIFERIGHVYLPYYIGYGGVGDTLMDVFCAILGASLVLLATRE